MGIENNNNSQIDKKVIRLINEAESYLAQDETILVYIAYTIAVSTPKEQKHTLYDVFLDQSLGTAFDLAKLKLGSEYIASSLVYYPISAGSVTFKQLFELGDNVTFIVQTLIKTENQFDQYLPWKQSNALAQKTNLPPSQQKSFWTERTTEKSSNALLALTSIPEIAVIKIVDRLHLLKESENLFDSKIIRTIAQQTLDVHAVVAEKLGIWSIKWQLEDAAFKLLEPDEYRAITQDLNEKRQEREAAINRATKILRKALRIEGLENAIITGRPKHLYGLYQKMKELRQSIEEVNDNLALRIVVDTKVQCYQAVDILYRTWPRVEGIYGDKPYRDWIASPKPNDYQSIHATVYFTQAKNRLLEVQIRTKEMHETAEYGIASHWVYRETKNSINKLQHKKQKYVTDMARLRRTLESRQKSS